MKNILFVCTGNICRSPMAEGLLRHMTARRGDVRVASAGLGAMDGQRPSLHAVEALAREGIDISGHRSQPVSAALLQRADFVFTMTRDHRDMLLLLFPEAGAKIRLLRAAVAAKGGRPDVYDPIGGSFATYETCKEEIKHALTGVLDIINRSSADMNTTQHHHFAFETSDLPALEAADPAIATAIHDEERRQFQNIELIASENFTSRAVR